jgi:hypothetical protein
MMDDGKVTDGLRATGVCYGWRWFGCPRGCLITFINSIFVYVRVIKNVLVLKVDSKLCPPSTTLLQTRALLQTGPLRHLN